MTRYLLDATTLFAAASGDTATLARLARLSVGDVAISAVVYSELLGAVAADGKNPRFAENLTLISQNFDVLPFDRKAAEAFGALLAKAPLKRRKTLDRLSAAHAISEGCALVTLNPKEFEGLPGLSIEAWGS
jgi:tRNA(fMet)-specific endonuclease VapC